MADGEALARLWSTVEGMGNLLRDAMTDLQQGLAGELKFSIAEENDDDAPPRYFMNGWAEAWDGSGECIGPSKISILDLVKERDERTGWDWDDRTDARLLAFAEELRACLAIVEKAIAEGKGAAEDAKLVGDGNG